MGDHTQKKWDRVFQNPSLPSLFKTRSISKKTRECIFYYAFPSPIGLILLARSQKGLCFLGIGEDEIYLKNELSKTFPNTQLISDLFSLRSIEKYTLQYLSNPFQKQKTPPLDLRGTPFEQHVWKNIQTIPTGKTVRYKEMAHQLQQPSSIQSIVAACSKNPIALIIPCHRVIENRGTVGQYRWGKERKEKILKLEHPQIDLFDPNMDAQLQLFDLTK